MQRFFLLEIISSKLNLTHKFLKGGEMAQHFLLSKEARGISGSKMLLLSKERAIKLLAKIRWADNGGKPVCPKCGNTKKTYFLKTTNYNIAIHTSLVKAFEFNCDYISFCSKGLIPNNEYFYPPLYE